MTPLRVRRDDWYKIVEAARQQTGEHNLPEYQALMNYYSVCIVSLVTPLSHKLWQLYRRINGTKNETFESYRMLPAFWVDACDVIEAEVARIDRIRQQEQDKAQRELLKRLNQNGNNKRGRQI